MKEKKHTYLLFFDEPTVHTDNETYSTTLEYLSKILYYMPKYTILSSATLPKEHELVQTISDFRSKFTNARIFNIVSHDCKKTIPLINQANGKPVDGSAIPCVN